MNLSIITLAPPFFGKLITRAYCHILEGSLIMCVRISSKSRFAGNLALVSFSQNQYFHHCSHQCFSVSGWNKHHLITPCVPTAGSETSTRGVAFADKWWAHTHTHTFCSNSLRGIHVLSLAVIPSLKISLLYLFYSFIYLFLLAHEERAGIPGHRVGVLAMWHSPKRQRLKNTDVNEREITET